MEGRSIDSPFTNPLASLKLREVKNYLGAAREGTDIQVPFLASAYTTPTEKAACYTHVKGENQAPHLVSAGTTAVGEAENSLLPLGRE